MSSGARLAFLRAAKALGAGSQLTYAHDAATSCILAAAARSAHTTMAIARFLYSGLGSGFRGVVARTLELELPTWRDVSGIAITRDGSQLLVADFAAHVVYVFSSRDGALLRCVGNPCTGTLPGSGPLQFHSPCQICIASDDFVFIADRGNHRVQILTPQLEFHASINTSVQIFYPTGVCASASAVVVVSDYFKEYLHTYDRATGAPLLRIARARVPQVPIVTTYFQWCGAPLCMLEDGRSVVDVNLPNSCVHIHDVERGTTLRTIDTASFFDVDGQAARFTTHLAVSAAGDVVVNFSLRPRYNNVVYVSSVGVGVGVGVVADAAPRRVQLVGTDMRCVVAIDHRRRAIYVRDHDDKILVLV